MCLVSAWRHWPTWIESIPVAWCPFRVDYLSYFVEGALIWTRGSKKDDSKARVDNMEKVEMKVSLDFIPCRSAKNMSDGGALLYQ